MIKKISVIIVAILISLSILTACITESGGNNELIPSAPDNEQNTDSDDDMPPSDESEIPDTDNQPEQPNVPNQPSIPNENLTPSAKYKLQATADVNIRQGAGTNTAVIGSLKRWSFAPYIEKSGNWYKILYNGKPAYVSVSYSQIVSIDMVVDPIERVISIGMDLLGTPYVYGAPRLLTWDFKMNPLFTGESYDCSSFVQYVFYKGNGVKLLGDSRSMSTQTATMVSISNLKRGDVVFMTTPGRWHLSGVERIGHVGIYLGGDKMLHTYGAPGVVVTSFSGVWRDRFISAKRYM